MRLWKEPRGGVTVISLDGRLDSETAPQVQQDLQALFPEDGLVVLDLSRTLYMSSAGLRVLLLIYRQAQHGTVRLALTGLSPEVRAIMEATGFLGFFTVVESVEQGVEALTV
ncbi:STAS domain-containing protein [Nonomuraea angiospora]|uniref:Anti-sigma factor antagonist n=2 Tax=Nonomuraea angiospora TaxID=46172 RepID=A0ABR9MI55_9ACTN|nr:STAS domain-containing protein [Nonomuraea angiospora]MBE1592595.1 anti-sigma B factor antagonist [Nonomuraea angiospora]MDX3109992.1 STAS domain-containing protein [Nonomuraea angiospora]